MSDPIKAELIAAAQAHTTLCMFAAIATLAESSDIESDHYNAVQRIVKICQAEQQKCLKKYDRAISRAERDHADGGKG